MNEKTIHIHNMKAKITSMKVADGKYIAVVFDVLNDNNEVLGSSSVETTHDEVVARISDVIAEFEKAHSVFDLFSEGDIIENGEVIKAK